MNLETIVREWLIQNGCAGLYCGANCWCSLKNLMFCTEPHPLACKATPIVRTTFHEKQRDARLFSCKSWTELLEAIKQAKLGDTILIKDQSDFNEGIIVGDNGSFVEIKKVID